jgi:hypothetical protein
MIHNSFNSLLLIKKGSIYKITLWNKSYKLLDNLKDLSFNPLNKITIINNIQISINIKTINNIKTTNNIKKINICYQIINNYYRIQNK